MGVTDQEIIGRTTHEAAVRELATAAKALAADRISTRVAVVRSPLGCWRVVREQSEIAADDVSYEFQVFRGDTVESPVLLHRIAFAAGEVWRLVTGRQDAMDEEDTATRSAPAMIVPASARARWARLTERQHAVAVRIALGERREDISTALRLSKKTYDTHRNEILARLQARGTADLTRTAIAAGVIHVEVER